MLGLLRDIEVENGDEQAVGAERAREARTLAQGEAAGRMQPRERRHHRILVLGPNPPQMCAVAGIDPPRRAQPTLGSHSRGWQDRVGGPVEHLLDPRVERRPRRVPPRKVLVHGDVERRADVDQLGQGRVRGRAPVRFAGLRMGRPFDRRGELTGDVTRLRIDLQAGESLACPLAVAHHRAHGAG